MIHENFQCEFYFIRHGESLSNATPGFAAGVNFDAPLDDQLLTVATTANAGRRQNLLQSLGSGWLLVDRFRRSTLRTLATSGHSDSPLVREMGKQMPDHSTHIVSTAGVP